ncbi:DUF4255 domain-containing protein [Pleionea sp. CnH1-48]|uniref:DUF4255 domain-containing protein n=1 Tax=Pleionea sp. CnH1-48 TaxID=2954494 RepID=UPI0020970212|nr:DUF4255 domain-containing protein [Pleionea sp. CnH1-48]MCO7226565.1 DUF4255 domain-containing protein [Pleionea sp. CnH1-48]
MINIAITHIASNLNQFLRHQYELDEDIVVVSNLTEQDGSASTDVNNKLTISLANVQKESTYTTNYPVRQSESNFKPSSPYSLHLNLYFMLAANFGGNSYSEGLKLLSSAANYFQSHAVFDHQSSPELDKGIEKLVVDIENLSIHDLSSLWGVLSGKYLPSVFYRLRMICMDSSTISGRVHKLREPVSDLKGQR